MKKFANRWFVKWARKNRLSHDDLLKAVADFEQEKGTVKLSAHLFKLRIAGQNTGKSGSYRTILVFKVGVRIVFVLGFGKNERDNISKSELTDLKELGKTYANLADDNIEILIKSGELLELKDGAKWERS